MENDTRIENKIIEGLASEETKKDRFLSASVLISVVVVGGAWIYATGLKAIEVSQKRIISADARKMRESVFEEKVLPLKGVVLPVRWSGFGLKMINVGVIDGKKFEELYALRGGLDDEAKNLLYAESNGNLKITSENSGIILNLLWALGLGNKNKILEEGPMADPRYGGAGPPAGGFASTGGWTLANGGAMEHYSRHQFIVLTSEQQELVERVSKSIYRPCCDNSTHFPDCNHGMAMLGLLELMASQGVSEEEMYRIALKVNAYWFPDTYLTIAQYLASKGIDWDKAVPKEILGANYSSGSGYRRILSQVTPPAKRSGGGCGI